MLKKIFLLTTIWGYFNLQSSGWGFFAHKLINRQAVFSLPDPLFQFYKYHIRAIVANAVNPDKRRCVVEGEAARHFIDLDHYSQEQIEKLPKEWGEAVKVIGEEQLNQHGIIPWHIKVMRNRLVSAFKDQNVEKIIKISAEAGHYLADINVPLHTTKNYNGQLSGQHGIHGLWESRLPELFAKNYDLFIGTAKYIKSWDDIIWSAMHTAHANVKKVLDLESSCSENFKLDKFSYEQRGATLQRVYSNEFCIQYNALLEDMVENQMRKAIVCVADFWYSCWIDAGSPNIDSLLSSYVLDRDDDFVEKVDEKKQITNFRDCD